MNNLRPIGLLDCPRKLWFGIIFRHMPTTWINHGALKPGHHGFVTHHGTDSSMIELEKYLEEAQENVISALVSSWDVNQAFDIVSRTAIRMELHRLGVP
jgi:hypothetical protein